MSIGVPVGSSSKRIPPSLASHSKPLLHRTGGRWEVLLHWFESPPCSLRDARVDGFFSVFVERLLVSAKKEEKEKREKKEKRNKREGKEEEREEKRGTACVL